MAQRERDKAKRGAARTEGVSGAPAEAVQRLETRMRALERERDALKAELETAHARIEMLEETRGQAVTRIDWVIDSLQNMAEKCA